jgi:hypothetical protein
LPTGLTTLGEIVFEGCNKIAISSIPEGITILRRCTFNECTSITRMLIPAGVTEIRGASSPYHGAFESNKNLRQVTALRPIPPTLGTNAFRNIHPEAVLCVIDNEALLAYKNSDWAQYFRTIKVCSAGMVDGIP